jgi:hypothetical protein
MKIAFLLMSLLGLMFFSCNKSACDTVHESLEGTWKMILVKDNATNTASTKPSSIKGDVILTFVPSSPTTGSFTGKTPSNDIWPSEYELGPKQELSIPNLSMTKVGETPWGEEFVNNIREAQQYSLEEEEKLNIRTLNKMLTFRKL